MLKYLFSVLIIYGGAMFWITFLGWDPRWALTQFVIILVLSECGRRLRQPPAQNPPEQP